MSKYHPLFWLLFILILAAFFAQVEIQIEGDAGWAGAMPTWKRTPQEWPLLNLIWGGRPMTGYHLWVFSFMAMVFHLPFLMLWQWSLRLEARALGSTMIFWILEDSLWFLMNPHFRMAGFRPGGEIWWHRKWFLGLPVDYWTFSLLGAVLMYLSFRTSAPAKTQELPAAPDA